MDGRISLFDNPGFTVSGENNEISSNFQLRNVDFDINVETDGELLISGVISHNNSHGMFDFSKSGEGTLTLSGNNTYGNDFKINAGTVVAASATALGSGKVSVGGETNATLVFANTVTAGTISLAGGSKFALDLSEFLVSVSDEDLILNILSGAASLSFDGFEGDVLTSDVIEGYFSEEALVAARRRRRQ